MSKLVNKILEGAIFNKCYDCTESGEYRNDAEQCLCLNCSVLKRDVDPDTIDIDCRLADVEVFKGRDIEDITDIHISRKDKKLDGHFTQSNFQDIEALYIVKRKKAV